MYKIDGLDGVEACYFFAGQIGVSPNGFTLRQLEQMAWGRSSQRRREMFEQSQLVWNLDGIDAERYLLFGELYATGRGGPVQLSPDLDAAVEAEAAKLRAANPDLPKLTMPVIGG